MKTEYTTVTAAGDVTEAMHDATWDVIEGWYASGEERIDWADVWDRIEGMELEDGTLLDLGPTVDSPAMRAMKRRARQTIKGH